MSKNRIRDLRKKKEMTQEELGEKFNVGKTTISNWESGITDPPNDTLLELSNFFGVSLDYLLYNKISEKEEIEALYKLFSELGYEIPKDMTLEDLEKAFKLLQVMKGDK